MSLVPMSSLPSEARTWCYGASVQPTEEALRLVGKELAAFLEIWTAHGADLRAGFDWLHDRFLVIAVDESVSGASGCSIDALTSQLRRLEEESGVELLDAAPVWYRGPAGDVRHVSREEFGRLAAEGSVCGTTPVFDLTVQNLGAVRTGSWEVEAGRSWHARLL